MRELQDSDVGCRFAQSCILLEGKVQEEVAS